MNSRLIYVQSTDPMPDDAGLPHDSAPTVSETVLTPAPVPADGPATTPFGFAVYVVLALFVVAVCRKLIIRK